MLKGYMGRILKVNLTTGKVQIETIEEEFCHKYLGGNGFGARLLYSLLKPGIDPLGPENILIFATGPVNGTIIPMASKFCVVSKSPLTLTYMDGFCSGSFGYELKNAGYDMMVVEGKSDEKVCILIDDDTVQIKKADHLWGLSTLATQKEVKRELGDSTVKVLCIGPAGENLVKYACIISDQRAFGTGGIGAVMGSKNLKAIAVRGTKAVSVYSLDGVKKFTRQIMEKVKKDPGLKVLSTYGTSVLTEVLQMMGGLPTRNWQTGVFEDSGAISGENLLKSFTKRNLSCFACLTPCGHYSVVEEGDFKGAYTNGPEFQTICAFGSLVGNTRLDAIIAADILSDEYGLGQNSAAASIAFAMECYEKGLITSKDTDGVDLRFGNYGAVLEMMRKITYREGFGNLLAEGVKRAAQILGKEAEKYALHVKGMEIACFSPRVLKSQAIGFAVSSRGPIHTEVRTTAECAGYVDRNTITGKGILAKELSDWSAIANSLVWCLSAERVIDIRLSEKIVEMINVVTGMGIDIFELTRIAERIHDLERAFNIREGFGRKDDMLPNRIMNEPIPEGPSKGAVITRDDLNTMINEYYSARGWDNNGVPERNKLLSLGLDDVAKEICST